MKLFKQLKITALLVSSSFLLTACNQSMIKAPTSAVNEEDRSLLKKIKSTQISLKKQAPDITQDSISDALAKEPYYPNIWDEMRLHFDLSNLYYGHYDDYITFYNERQRHMEKISQRAEPYLYYIFNEVKSRGMPYEIALLPAVESGFRAQAHSSQYALGLWQFIPSTGDIFDLHRNWWYDGRKDVVKSTQAALDYLQKLYKLNNNDWLLALASYNSGLGNVYKAQKKYRKLHKNKPGIENSQPDFWQIKPFLPKETQSYVPKLLALSHIYEYRELFALNIQPVANEPFFEEVQINKQIALNKAMKLSNTDSEIFNKLNPAYSRLATPPKGPFNILLPVENATNFSQHLVQNSDLFNVQWQRHKIKPGDSLSVIAYNYNTSSRAIKKLNNLRSSNIRAGKTLLIPIPSGKAHSVNTQLVSNSKNRVHSSVNNPNLIAFDKNGIMQGIYQVKAGDSLWDIAKKFEVSSRDISKWNKISLKSALRIGQKLTIYSPHFGQKIIHTLKKGESLWLVAKRYQVQSTQIAKWNGINKNQVLQPGMKLSVYQANNGTFKYIVKTGDNLSTIAAKNNVSTQKLAKHNKISKNSMLKPGQVLQIPSSS